MDGLPECRVGTAVNGEVFRVEFEEENAKEIQDCTSNEVRVVQQLLL